MNKRSVVGINNISKNHWHPCCQENPGQSLQAPYHYLDENDDGEGSRRE